MNLNIINDDGIIKQYPVKKECFFNQSLVNRIGYIGAQSKEENALNIFKAYFSNAKAILFDETNQAILKQLKDLNIPEFATQINAKTIFDEKDFSFIYFTSGSTGSPVAALKTRENIASEVKVLTALLQEYKIKKVIVTVPFIHLYGTLFGLMYPLINNIDIVLKEHFLPNDLLSMIDPYTMIVTTPLYIKSLNKLSQEKDLSQSIFISSTAPLDVQNIKIFTKKYKTDIIQIFGSTETGGIAHKVNDDPLWKSFRDVQISTNKNDELKVKSPFVSSVLYENKFKYTNNEIQTFDYIKQTELGFKLIGRSSKIIKLAGKRYSTVQIENILENVKTIRKALVFAALEENTLRGEYLDITIESDQIFLTKDIKKILQHKLSNLKFSIKLKIVKEIPINQIGKKLRIK